MKNFKLIAQQVLVCIVVIFFWKIYEGDTSRRWEQTYAASDKAVVEIITPGTRGTGFIMRDSGAVVIITNQHVVRGTSEVQLHFYDNVFANAEVLDASSSRDVAVLRASKDVNMEHYAELTPGISARLRIGDELMTIGHPLGQSHHLSIGLYTGKELQPEVGTLLRLNMPVDPGNSGGPLIDNKGHVVGIITFKEAQSASIAFAVPIEHVKSLNASQ